MITAPRLKRRYTYGGGTIKPEVTYNGGFTLPRNQTDRCVDYLHVEGTRAVMLDLPNLAKVLRVEEKYITMFLETCGREYAPLNLRDPEYPGRWYSTTHLAMLLRAFAPNHIYDRAMELGDALSFMVEYPSMDYEQPT